MSLRVLILSLALPVFAQTPADHARHMLEGAFSGANCTQCAKRPRPDVMIDGYCPVALLDTRELKEGSGSYRAVFWGKAYHCASPEALAAFKADPKRYIMGVAMRYRTLNMKPELAGHCPVALAEDEAVTKGLADHSAFIAGKLYYCASAEARERLLGKRELVAAALQRFEEKRPLKDTTQQDP